MDCLQYVRVKCWCDKTLLCQKANSDQCIWSASSLSPKKFKVQPEAWLVFWDRQGVGLVDSMPRGHTVNADYYCTLLSDRLRPVICKKRRGLLQNGHSSWHSTCQTVEKIEENFTMHLQYSPDLVPSDFHLFGPLNEPLGSIKFQIDWDVHCSTCPLVYTFCNL